VVAALLAGSVLLSRVLGYGREMVLAYHLGATPEADAYRAAFQIPDILFHFLSGGAFAVAFVPFYTRARERRGPEAARRLLATVFGTMTLVAVAAAALLWIWAEPLVALQFPRFAPETRELTTRLTRIVLPAQIFFVAGGVLRAALMANDRFWTQAVAPLVYNLGIIAGGLGLGAVLGAEGFAWGALVGAVLGPFLLPLVDLGRAGLRLGFRFAPWEREFLAYLWRAAPLIVGVSLLTVDEWYDRWFGQLVGDGVVAQLGYARQLMLAPVAVVGQAVATAALPALSQLWSEGRREDLDRALLTTLRASLGLAVVLGAGAFAVAEPAVALLFERGRFTPEDSARVAALLRVFAFAVPGWVTLQVAGRGFYAREDMWRPMLLGTVVALAAVPLYLTLGRSFGAEGIAAAGGLAMSANAVLLLLLLRGVHGGPRLAPLLATLLRAAPVAGLAGAVGSLAARAGGAPLAGVLVGACAFGIVALPGVWLLGDEATREVVRRSLARLRRRRGG
jgi:putative peptidoglycan lipid II flippase